MMAKYAPDGWSYYSVITPSVADETLVPADPADRTKAHRAEIKRLNLLADDYGTHVHRSSYELL